MGQLQFSMAGSVERERSRLEDPARAAKALIIAAIAGLFLLPSKPGAVLVVSPPNVDFAALVAGGTQEQDIDVRATGDGPAGAITTTVTGDGFTLIASDCAELAKDQRCSVRVRFAPSAASTTYSGSVEVRGENTHSVTVSLRGATRDGPSPVPPATVISASPNPLDFRTVDAGETRAQQIKISVKGGTPAGRIETIVKGDAFALDDAGCRKTLTENDSCTVTVSFTPAEAASYTGKLSIRSAHAQTANVALRGTGRDVGPVKMMIMPRPGQFSPQPVGTTSGPYQLTITNQSRRDIVLAYGDDSSSGPFRIEGVCAGRTLKPQEHCNETATFVPTATGSFTGSRDILANGSVVDSFVLRGQGTAAGLSVPDRLVFTGLATSRAVTISNTGSADLIITHTTIPPARNSSFRIPPTACISHIAPGATCDVPVTIRGGMRQTVQQGSLVIDSNDAGSPHKVELFAEIYTPKLVADPTSINFDTDQRWRAIRITNQGNAPTGPMTPIVRNSSFIVGQNSCDAGIDPGASCEIAVRFLGRGTGVISGYLILSAISSGVVLSVPLQGQVVPPEPAPEPVIVR